MKILVLDTDETIRMLVSEWALQGIIESCSPKPSDRDRTWSKDTMLLAPSGN